MASEILKYEKVKPSRVPYNVAHETLAWMYNDDDNDVTNNELILMFSSFIVNVTFFIHHNP